MIRCRVVCALLGCVVAIACVTAPAVQDMKVILPGFLKPDLKGALYAPTLGRVVEKRLSTYVVEPTNPHFETIRITADPATDEPLHMEIVFAVADRPSPAAMKRWLGKARTVPLLHPTDPDRVIFYFEDRQLPYSAAFIATFAEGASGPLSEVTIRRDPNRSADGKGM